MRINFVRPSLAFVLALLLGLSLFTIDAGRVNLHMWARYLLPLAMVYFWGRRREIYPTAVFLSLLLAATGWLELPFSTVTPLDVFANHLLPFLVLWSLAWLSVQRRETAEEQARRQVQLEAQVQLRTAELAASEQRYRLLAENATDVVWAVDLAGTMTYLSPSVVRLRGYTREEMLAMDWDERLRAGFPPLFLQAAHAGLADLRAGRLVAPGPFIARNRHKNGFPVWLETELGALYDDAGRPTGLRATTRNVTAREDALAALRRSQDHFAKLFHSSPSGIVLSRVVDGTYLDANEAFSALTGYSRQEMIGHTSIELGIMTPAARAEKLAVLAEHGHAGGIDLQIYSKTGEPVDVLYSLEATEENGEPCIISTVVDIRERKHAEQVLRALNEELEDRVAARTAQLQSALVALQNTLSELQAANRLKDEFLAVISHELRTPLTGILCMSEMLADHVSGPLNDRQANYVKSITQSGARLLHVVNTILSYTHLLSGKHQLHAEPCSLAYLLDICATSHSSRVAERRQILTVKVVPPDLTITADAAAVVEILKRLLDNAVKFTPAGGHIGLEAHLSAAPGSTDQPVGVDLVVWDTGIGIAADQREHLFHAFTQGDGRLSRHHEGIGLSLAYVDRMVHLMGGTVAVTSTPGEGSRFTITLPTRSSSRGASLESPLKK